MLKLISSGPSEFLVVGRKGKVRNLGTAGNQMAPAGIHLGDHSQHQTGDLL